MQIDRNKVVRQATRDAEGGVKVWPIVVAVVTVLAAVVTSTAAIIELFQ